MSDIKGRVTGATPDAARTTHVSRTTNETDVAVSLDLDGTGATRISTGIGFLDHMLEAFGRHGSFDLEVSCTGDLEVDGHHTTEDIGIVIGQAFAQALGDRTGITRYGDVALPMDEALMLVAVDVSGRGRLHWDCDIPLQYLGSFDTALAREFLDAFATNSGITLHVRQLAGDNAHHELEAVFKGVARALRTAISLDSRCADAIPSTKGAL